MQLVHMQKDPRNMQLFSIMLLMDAYKNRIYHITQAERFEHIDSLHIHRRNREVWYQLKGFY